MGETDKPFPFSGFVIKTGFEILSAINCARQPLNKARTKS